ncbi:MAG: hypothetical protein HZB18_12905 [Chloroflexi bacterium]|nr:hypothetical protein [Chloroflexota bacterium]
MLNFISGLGGFSRLRNHSRGVHPTAGQQRRFNQSKQKNAKPKSNLANNASRPFGIILAFTPPDDEPSGYTYKPR